MTTATLPRLKSASEASSRLLGLVTDIFAGIMEGREISRRYDLLARMTNTELAQLGLTRQDIPRAAVDGIAGV